MLTHDSGLNLATLMKRARLSVSRAGYLPEERKGGEGLVRGRGGAKSRGIFRGSRGIRNIWVGGVI